MAKISTNFPTEFHPELFEAAIDRHGQYVQWYSSLVCFCADESGRADPACRKCLGRGYLYYPAVQRRRIETVMSLGTALLNVKYPIHSVISIHNMSMPEISIAYSSVSDTQITLTAVQQRGQYYLVEYNEALEFEFEGSAVWLGNGIVQANFPSVFTNQGVFIGRLSKVSLLFNTTTNKEMHVDAFWENKVLTRDSALSSDVLQISCKYTKPTKFLVNRLTQQQRKESFAIFQDADASCSFPGYLEAGRGDIITLLKASQQDSIIGNSNGTSFHRLPFFHIASLVRVEDAIGEISDAVIVRDNEIMFPTRAPDGRFSAAFLYHPSFVMMGELPSLRYGENKVLPKKVALKRYMLTNRQEQRPQQTSGHEVQIL